jgi:hypothetical protein
LRLGLGDGAYEWAFIEAGSGRVGDGGVGKCR